MNRGEHPLTQEEFDAIYSKVPRLTVEIIVRNSEAKIYLTKRAIEPCKGLWHLPGGTVRFGEPMTKAVERIAARELGIEVARVNNVGFIEYPSHYLSGMDSPVGIVFEIEEYTKAMKANSEATAGAWFDSVPEKIHPDQDTFLIENRYLRDRQD